MSQKEPAPFVIADAATLHAALGIILRAFSALEGRVDPPPSALSLTEADLAAAEGELWGIGTPLRGCMLLTLRGDVLDLAQLAVDPVAQGQGWGRRLIEWAAQRGRALGAGHLRLYSRVELVENHALFFATGFEQTGVSRHAGYDEPTSLIFQRALSAPDTPDLAP